MRGYNDKLQLRKSEYKTTNKHTALRVTLLVTISGTFPLSFLLRLGVVDVICSFARLVFLEEFLRNFASVVEFFQSILKHRLFAVLIDKGVLLAENVVLRDRFLEQLFRRRVVSFVLRRVSLCRVRRVVERMRKVMK